jgi:hypothetical protein
MWTTLPWMTPTGAPPSPKRFGEKFLGEDFGAQPVGDFVMEFVEHDAAGDGSVGFAGGGHVGVAVAMGAAEIFFEAEVTVTDDK